MQNEWIFHSPKLEEKQREEQSRQDEKRQDEKRREEQKRSEQSNNNKRELKKDGVKEMVKLTVKNKPNYEDVVQKMLDRAKNHGADLSKVEVKGEPKFIDSSRQALQNEMRRDKARYEEMKVEAFTKQELSKWAKEAEQNKAPQKQQSEQTQKATENQKRQELEAAKQAEQNKQKERQR